MCEAVGVLRVQLLTQQDDGDLDGRQDELPRRRVVHRRDRRALSDLRWDVYICLLGDFTLSVGR